MPSLILPNSTSAAPSSLPHTRQGQDHCSRVPHAALREPSALRRPSLRGEESPLGKAASTLEVHPVRSPRRPGWPWPASLAMHSSFRRSCRQQGTGTSQQGRRSRCPRPGRTSQKHAPEAGPTLRVSPTTTGQARVRRWLHPTPRSRGSLRNRFGPPPSDPRSAPLPPRPVSPPCRRPIASPALVQSPALSGGRPRPFRI